jgi:uncharacterized membrane protein
MDAVLSPNRSLSRRGLRLIMGVVVAYNLLVMAFLLAIHAFPVPIFLGLDVAGLWLAFRINARRSGWSERVRVSADQVQVSHRRPPSGERTVWSSPTAFTRVSLDRAGEHEASVRLTLSGRQLSLAAGLSPQERRDFAGALQRAITAARAERHAS